MSESIGINMNQIIIESSPVEKSQNQQNIYSQMTENHQKKISNLRQLK